MGTISEEQNCDQFRKLLRMIMIDIKSETTYQLNMVHMGTVLSSF